MRKSQVIIRYNGQVVRIIGQGDLFGWSSPDMVMELIRKLYLLDIFPLENHKVFILLPKEHYVRRFTSVIQIRPKMQCLKKDIQQVLSSFNSFIIGCLHQQELLRVETAG